MIDKVFSIISKSANKSDDDFADRINYRFTAGLLAMGAFLITWYIAFGDVIQCWTPTYFAGAWIDYANNLCFIKNTYYLPMDIPIEKGREEQLTYSITYYQWIPLFFMGLAMCFYIPRAIWFNVFSHHFVDINAIVDLLTSFDNAVNPETRDPAVQQVARHIHRYLYNSTEYRESTFFKARKSVSKKCKTFAFYIGRRYGLQVTLIYLIIKMLYIIIGTTQLYWIDSFLRGSAAQNWTMTSYYTNIFSTSYVFNVLENLINGTNWENSPTFPRVTMCDFETRALGQNQKFSIQCVLPINLFNEKIFLFLYCWILVVVLITLVNFLLWVYRIAFAFNRQKYIMKHLTLMGKIDDENRVHSLRVTKRLIRVFIHDYLRPDGVFLLRLIAINTNCLIASEIISSLWDAFIEDPKIHKKAETYNMKFREQHGSESLEKFGTGSAIGNDDDYSTSQNRLIVKRRSQRSFSIFQHSLNDSSQITPPSTYPEPLADTRKLSRRDTSQVRPVPSFPQKVGFHEPTPVEASSKQRKKSKKSAFYTCIDCDDADDENEYSGPLPESDSNDPGSNRTRKTRSKKPKSWINKMKDVFVYESSGTETDISDDNPDADSGPPSKSRKGGKKFFDGCLGRSEPGESMDEDRGMGSVRSAGTSNNQEHRREQDTIPTNQRRQLPNSDSFNNNIPPPTYTQASMTGPNNLQSPSPASGLTRGSSRNPASCAPSVGSQMNNI